MMADRARSVHTKDSRDGEVGASWTRNLREKKKRPEHAQELVKCAVNDWSALPRGITV